MKNFLLEKWIFLLRHFTFLWLGLLLLQHLQLPLRFPSASAIAPRGSSVCLLFALASYLRFATHSKLNPCQPHRQTARLKVVLLAASRRKSVCSRQQAYLAAQEPLQTVVLWRLGENLGVPRGAGRLIWVRVQTERVCT